ncbi:MAG: hypothetical protein ACI32E_01025 [Bacilli bacterium]
MKTILKRIIQKLKDPLNIVIFIIVFIVFYTPVWLGLLMYLLTDNPFHLSYMGGWITFWSLPFTPALAIIFILTFSFRKLINHIINKNSKKQQNK